MTKGERIVRDASRLSHAGYQMERSPWLSSLVSSRLLKIGAVVLLAGVLTALMVMVVDAQATPPSEVSIDQLHIFLIVSGDRLQVSEYYLLGNSGDTAYSGQPGGDGRNVTLVFPLPENATNVLLDNVSGEPARYELTDAGIADTQPITPGVATTEVRFAYEMPLTPGSAIVHPLPVPVQMAVLLVSGDQWQIQGSGLASLGQMDMGEDVAQAYSFEPQEPVDSLTFSVLAGSPSVGSTAEDVAAASVDSSGLQLGVGIVVLIGGAVAGLVFWRSTPVPEVPGQVKGDVDALVELDEQYAEGHVSDAAYTKRRDELKRRIRHRLQRQDRPDWDMGG